MNFTNVIPAALTFILLIVSFFYKTESKPFKWITFIAGLVLMGFVISKNMDDEDRGVKDSDNIVDVKDAVKAIQDSLNKIGLNIEEKTGKILLIDSQLLKKSFPQIINYNTYHTESTPTSIQANNEPSEVQQKLNSAFDNLTKGQDYEKQIAIDYIIQNFPPKASDYQINQIRAYYPYLKTYEQDINHLDKFGQVNRLLINQGKHPLIIRFFKDILIDKGSNKLAWDYLFKYDKKITLAFIDSTFKNHNPLFRRYGDVLRFSVGVNNNICIQLLNSQSIVDLVMSSTSKQDLKSIIWNIDYGIKEHSASLDYKSSYFYQQYLKYQ